MLTNKDAILEVARHVETIDAGASSHWRLDDQERGEHPLKNDPFDFTYGDHGFSAIGPIGAISTKTGLLYKTAHWFLQIPYRIIGRRFSTFRAIDLSAVQIAKRQHRAYDKDLLRHALTLAMLRDRLDLESETDPIAVIGDGFANMATLILENLPESRVILVNLTKTLLVDLAFTFRALPEAGIALVSDAGEMAEALESPDIRIIALQADHAGLMADAPVSLGINIMSMMEMDPAVTNNYFQILRRSSRTSTAFYCCNRVEKQLPDGTVTRFFDYPWNPDDEILVDEPSPWDWFGYRGRPPFYYKNKKSFQHRLVRLRKYL